MVKGKKNNLNRLGNTEKIWPKLLKDWTTYKNFHEKGMECKGKLNLTPNNLLNSGKNDTNKLNSKSAKALMPSWTRSLKGTWKHFEIISINFRKKDKEQTLN